MISASPRSRREQQTGDGLVHVGQKKRVGQLFEARVQKVFDGVRLAEVAVEQALDEQREILSWDAS